MKTTHFERALFLSWYCSKADCKFCFMSTQKNKIKIKDPRLARRKNESIYAEALICKLLGWKIEFLSGGYESFSVDELVNLAKNIKKITGEKQWLNIGTLSFAELKRFKPHIEGFSGPVECISPKIQKKVCPSKPIRDIERDLDYCKKLRLKRSITIIIGLGETEKEISLLIKFIKKHGLDRITFYALNPHKGAYFKKGPKTEYYVKWIKAVRQNFPKITLIAGSWTNRLKEIHLLLQAGADHITKFKSIKLFNSSYAKQIEKEVASAGRKFEGSLTKLPKVNWNKEVDKLTFFDSPTREKIKKKVRQYIGKMKRGKAL